MDRLQQAPVGTGDRILGIVPAQGWWVVREIVATRADEIDHYPRDPVAVWALVEDSGGGRVVVPMVEDDGHTLRGPDKHFLLLAHESQLGHCHCRDWPRDAEEADDIWWCLRCPGIIGEGA